MDSRENPSSFGIGNDLQKLKASGTASLSELREFVAKLRGKNPQEVLGELAQSRLVSCTVLSTFLWVFGMAALTAGPYLWEKLFPAESKPVAKAGPNAGDKPTGKADAKPAAPESSDKPESKSEDKPDPAAKVAGSNVTQSDLEAAAKKLDVSETKSADPKKNPREADLDNLLDGVK